MASFENREADCSKAAINNVVWMLQRAGQIDKIGQIKKRVIQKKISIDSTLKAKIESKGKNIDLAVTKLEQLKGNLAPIEVSMMSLIELFNRVPKLNENLREVRDERMIHSQYVTAIENLKHIFTVPEMTERAKNWIQEGKLLHAHQCIQELENSRDDLLFEVHKLPKQSLHDKAMLSAYFSDVQNTSDMLQGQIQLILSRLLNTIRKIPSEIVTALRIVEREENADKFALQQKQKFGYLAAGRPKKWREMAFDIFKKEVSNRIEGTQISERESNKLWLVTYLEITRQQILQDLRIIKTLCVPCFPPFYNIFQKFVEMYHNALSSHLQELVSNGLEGNEIATLLAWVINTYASHELMSSEYLKVDVTLLATPLLPYDIMESLQKQYLDRMEANFKEWMSKALEAEVQEWISSSLPELENGQYFVATSPILIIKMITENLELSKTISNELTFRAFLLSLEQLTNYGKLYQEKIVIFKKNHFDDRSKVLYFTHYVISIVNNCSKFLELVIPLKEFVQFSKLTDHLNSSYEKLQKTFESLREEASNILLEEAFLDLDKHFDELLTQRWLKTSIAIDTICITLDDYFQDYNHLYDSNYLVVLKEAEKLVIRKYLTNILQRKMSLKTFEECKVVADRIIHEMEKIRQFFHKYLPKQVAEEFQNPFSLVKMFADTLKCEDFEMISLDLHGLVDKYPNVTEDHLHRLLYLRGDMPRSAAKDTIAFVMKNRKRVQFVQFNDGILEKIVFNDRLINWQL